MRVSPGLALGVVALMSTCPLLAWHAEGHRITTFEAVTLLAEELPQFLQDGRDQMAWDSIDPDLMCNRSLPQLRDRESPDHYLDLELLQGGGLPDTRSKFLEHIASPEVGMGIEKVGGLPYAVVEATQRLTLAFAQVRHQPADEHLQAKVMLYAAQLAHYAADLCQPLHTTIHHDGRALEDYSSPYTGIHQQVDALIGRLKPQAEIRGEPLVLKPIFPAVVEELKRSHAEVDRVYQLEGDLALLEAGGEPSAELRSWTRDRYRASVLFTASLILTAWRESADLQIPDWGLPEQPPTN
ncbi:MAG: hypothetical protein GWP16_00885 [Nitrospirae bacterium]|nr:hypothetical protein [Nitrospirota bacterium]